MSIAMQYLGMAIRGIPYMGVGRNLAYRRSLFFTNKGFGSHNHLISGDDDLFVNSIGTWQKYNVLNSVLKHIQDQFHAATLNEWITQKKRHLTTAPYYKFRDKFMLITEPLTRVIFYASFIVLLIFPFSLAMGTCSFCNKAYHPDSVIYTYPERN